MSIVMNPTSYRAGFDNIRGFVDETGRAPIPANYTDIVVEPLEATVLDEAREFLRSYYTDEQVAYDDASSREIIRERGVFGPPEQVAEHLESFVDAGVERFVVRFTAADQRKQLPGSVTSSSRCRSTYADSRMSAIS